MTKCNLIFCYEGMELSVHTCFVFKFHIDNVKSYFKIHVWGTAYRECSTFAINRDLNLTHKSWQLSSFLCRKANRFTCELISRRGWFSHKISYRLYLHLHRSVILVLLAHRRDMHADFGLDVVSTVPWAQSVEFTTLLYTFALWTFLCTIFLRTMLK